MTFRPTLTDLIRYGATILTAIVCAFALLDATTASAQGVNSPYSATSGETLGEEFGEDSERYFGPSDFVLDAEGEYFYVLGADAKVLERVRVDGTAPGERLALDFRPAKLAFLPGETKLAIVGGEDRGRLALVEIAKRSDDAREILPLKLEKTVKAGHTPTDVATRSTDAGDFIYVAACFAGRIEEYDAATLEETRSWDAGREPYAIAVTPDQKKLVVANRIEINLLNCPLRIDAGQVKMLPDHLCNRIGRKVCIVDSQVIRERDLALAAYEAETAFSASILKRRNSSKSFSSTTPNSVPETLGASNVPTTANG